MEDGKRALAGGMAAQETNGGGSGGQTSIDPLG